MTLKVIPQLHAFSMAIRRTFVQYFTRFKLTAGSHGPSVTAGLLVFISEVDCYVRRTISGKLLAFGFVATMRLLSNYFDLLFYLFSWKLYGLLYLYRETMLHNESEARFDKWITVTQDSVRH